SAHAFSTWHRLPPARRLPRTRETRTHHIHTYVDTRGWLPGHRNPCHHHLETFRKRNGIDPAPNRPAFRGLPRRPRGGLEQHPGQTHGLSFPGTGIANPSHLGHPVLISPPLSYLLPLTSYLPPESPMLKKILLGLAVIIVIFLVVVAMQPAD